MCFALSLTILIGIIVNVSVKLSCTTWCRQFMEHVRVHRNIGLWWPLMSIRVYENSFRRLLSWDLTKGRLMRDLLSGGMKTEYTGQCPLGCTMWTRWLDGLNMKSLTIIPAMIHDRRCLWLTNVRSRSSSLYYGRNMLWWLLVLWNSISASDANVWAAVELFLWTEADATMFTCITSPWITWSY